MDKIKKYYANFIVEPGIGVVWVDKETDSFVWIKGRRNSKESKYDRFADTWEEAHQWMIDVARKKVQRAQRNVDYYSEELNKILALKEDGDGSDGE